MADLNQAREFMAANARLLDRRRFESLAGDGDPEATLAVLGGYGNDDGGFGWALHPDLRSATSQPVAAMHVFEILEEVAAEASPIAASLCDWLDHASLADGGLPFALPFDDGAGSAPMWAATDSSKSSPPDHLRGVRGRPPDHAPQPRRSPSTPGSTAPPSTASERSRR